MMNQREKCCVLMLHHLDASTDGSKERRDEGRKSGRIGKGRKQAD